MAIGVTTGLGEISNALARVDPDFQFCTSGGEGRGEARGGDRGGGQGQGREFGERWLHYEDDVRRRNVQEPGETSVADELKIVWAHDTRICIVIEIQAFKKKNRGVVLSILYSLQQHYCQNRCPVERLLPPLPPTQERVRPTGLVRGVVCYFGFRHKWVLAESRRHGHSEAAGTAEVCHSVFKCERKLDRKKCRPSILFAVMTSCQPRVGTGRPFLMAEMRVE